MSAYSVARAEIRDALKDADISAYSTKPDHATPPFVFVGPGDPYIDFEAEGVSFGGDLVNHQVTVVGDLGVNELRADELDDQIVTVLGVLEDLDGYAVKRVNRPGHIKVNGQDYLAVAIDVTSEVRRGDM